MLENVEEFKTWGPLGRRHHPIKAKQGKTFEKFVKQLTDLGYEVQFRELTAADYGAPTMRKRFFMIARCDGKPIVWPKPTHAPADSEKVKAGLLEPYVGAYTQIDFSRPCPSIFDTSEEIKEKYGIRAVRPLAQKTMGRIARGFIKFVLNNPEPFIVQVNHSGARSDYCNSMNEPLRVITSKHGFGIVDAKIAPYMGTNTTNHPGGSCKDPLDTVPTHDRFGLVTIHGVDYQIVDIGLRMLEPRELYGCQGFPDDYIIDHDYTGKAYPRSEQVRRCGNAVCPPIPAALVRANLPEMCVAERTPNMKIEAEQTGQLRFA